MNDFIPSWYGWVVVAMVSPGLIVLIGVTVAFLFHRAPQVASEAPRYFHILGFDPKTNAGRELTLLADDPSAARGLAQLQGIIVTDVTAVAVQPQSSQAEEGPEEDRGA